MYSEKKSSQNKPLAPSHTNKPKKCKTCQKVKPITDYPMTSGKNYRYYRPDCKRCHSDYTHRAYQEKQLEKYPDRYLECNNEDCNWIWDKRRTTTCPKCSSISLQENR